MDFVISVVEDVLANLITVSVITLFITLTIYMRFSGIEQKFRRYIKPNKRVLFAPPISITSVIHKNPSPFQPPVREHELEKLIHFYSERNNVHPHNGKSIRLDQLGFETQISTVGFFDFLSTNLTVYPSNLPIPSILQQLKTAWKWFQMYPTIRRVYDAVRKYGKPNSVKEVLANPHLANIVAVSVLVIDSNGQLGIIERSNRVAISSGQFATTSSGTVSETDLNTPDPFLHCAIRELKEELNLEFDTLQFDGIVVPKQKMQPIFLYHIKMNRTWEEVLPLIHRARDFNQETKHMYAVPISQAVRFIAHVRSTDTAAYQIWQYCQQNGHASSWSGSIFRPIKLNRYRLRR